VRQPSSQEADRGNQQDYGTQPEADQKAEQSKQNAEIRFVNHDGINVGHFSRLIASHVRFENQRCLW